MERVIKRIFKLLPWVTPETFVVDICLGNSVYEVTYPFVELPQGSHYYFELLDKINE